MNMNKCLLRKHQDFPGGSVVKNPPAIQETTCNAETWVLSLGWESPPGEGNGNPLQYSWLGNLMDRGAGWVHGVPRVGHNLVTKTPPPPPGNIYLHIYLFLIIHHVEYMNSI